jgi:hypothetical protein
MAAVFCVSPVQAATIQLGDSGWQASWDNSLDGFVDLAIDLVTDDAIFLEKSAEFIFPPGPGGFESINITFQQIAVDAVSQIVISDEILTNSTGADWGGFNMQLLDGGDATFNPGLSSGFNTSPFNNQSYSDGNTNFSVSGGVVSNGSVWFPGTGPGELYIDVNTADAAPFTVFTLKETPVPEPGTVGLLLGGAAVLLRRKK